MAPLKKWESAKLLLNLYPRDGKNFPIAELGVKQTTEYEDVVEALAKHNLVKVVDGHPGAMVRNKVADRGVVLRFRVPLHFVVFPAAALRGNLN